jgi:hypothetical protein
VECVVSGRRGLRFRVGTSVRMEQRHWIILCAFDVRKSRRICGSFLVRSIDMRMTSMQSVGVVVYRQEMAFRPED